MSLEGPDAEKFDCKLCHANGWYKAEHARPSNCEPQVGRDGEVQGQAKPKPHDAELGDHFAPEGWRFIAGEVSGDAAATWLNRDDIAEEDAPLWACPKTQVGVFERWWLMCGFQYQQGDHVPHRERTRLYDAVTSALVSERNRHRAAEMEARKA